jgi:hypothetical protein
MIAIRVYWNPAEAALEKSVLDNYEVACALFHENANLYGRAPMAMPIRLVVRDDQAEWAVCILNGNFEAAAEFEQSPGEMPPEGGESSLSGLREGRPWELLIIAFYFFLPAICFLQTHYPAKPSYSRAMRSEIAAVTIAHFLGWIAITFALLLLVLFERSCRSAASMHNLSDQAR